MTTDPKPTTALPEKWMEAIRKLPIFKYAYRYHDCVRYNDGESVNGGKPIEVIPLYDAGTIAPLLAAEREAMRDSHIVLFIDRVSIGQYGLVARQTVRDLWEIKERIEAHAASGTTPAEKQS